MLNNAIKHKERGNHLFAKDYQKALEQYESAVEYHPTLAAPWLNMPEHNCVSWCCQQANLIGWNVSVKWYNFAVTLLSDVTQSQDDVKESSCLSSMCFRSGGV